MHVLVRVCVRTFLCERESKKTRKLERYEGVYERFRSCLVMSQTVFERDIEIWKEFVCLIVYTCVSVCLCCA